MLENGQAVIQHFIYSFYGDDFTEDDDFFQSSPYYFVSKRLKEAIQKEGLTGFRFKEINSVYASTQESTGESVFMLIELGNSIIGDDLYENKDDLEIYLSEKALNLVSKFRIKFAVVGAFSEDEKFIDDFVAKLKKRKD